MSSINASVTHTLVSLTGLGVVFYVAIVIAGTSSYACPFQTPASIALRGPWKKVRCGLVSFIIHSKRRTRQMWNRGVRSLLRHQSLPITIPLENVEVHGSEPWMKPKDLAIIRRTNAGDVGCVSWVLRNITDPEALDAAIRLAEMVRWFDDGINVDPPYDLIVSTFKACFDPTGKLYPGVRDRAYYSGRAMIWIHTLARCKSEEFANTFPLPNVEYTTSGLDPDIEHLLWVEKVWFADWYCFWPLKFDTGHTPSHIQWISNLLLYLSWATRTANFENFKIAICRHISSTKETTVPLDATLNRLLVWCVLLGPPVKEEVLKVQDKSYDILFSFFRLLTAFLTSDHLEQILYQLSAVVVSVLATNSPGQHTFILHILRDLIKLETRPVCLTGIAYDWCSTICKNRQSPGDWEGLLLVSLEIGFRHLDFRDPDIRVNFTNTKHHPELVDVVFKSQESEVIADLLQAWTCYSAHALLGLCARPLVGLYNLVPFSPRLRRLIIRSVEFIGCKGFEEVGVERFVELLNHLCVTVEDMDSQSKWGKLLLDTLQASEGARCLFHWYWELLVELAILWSRSLQDKFAYSPQIVTFLVEAQEWSKLECWMAIVWMIWPPEAGGITEEDLDHSVLLLFRQQSDAVQKLEQWMERWSQSNYKTTPESFQRICRQAQEAAQRDVS